VGEYRSNRDHDLALSGERNTKPCHTTNRLQGVVPVLCPPSPPPSGKTPRSPIIDLQFLGDLPREQSSRENPFRMRTTAAFPQQFPRKSTPSAKGFGDRGWTLSRGHRAPNLSQRPVKCRERGRKRTIQSKVEEGQRSPAPHAVTHHAPGGRAASHGAQDNCETRHAPLAVPGLQLAFLRPLRLKNGSLFAAYRCRYETVPVSVSVLITARDHMGVRDHLRTVLWRVRHIEGCQFAVLKFKAIETAAGQKI